MSVPFKPFSTFAIFGSTQSGKTSFIFKVLKNLNELFETNPPKQVIYCYGIYQKLYDQMQNELGNIITFLHGLPSREQIEDLGRDRIHKLIILDDLMSEIASSKTIQDLYTQFSHHLGLSVVLISQNLFQQGKASRTIAINTSYLILMKSMRTASQISYLGRQLYPGKPGLLEQIYTDCMSVPYGYLIIDCNPHSDDKYRLRSHIFPGENTVIYQPI